MSDSLTLQRTQTHSVTESSPLYVPAGWGMFTNVGNRRLTTLASRAHKCATKYVETGVGDPRKICYKFVLGWARMWDKKTYCESTDTAVRECVGGFHDDLYKAMCGTWDAYEVWDAHYSKASTTVYKSR